MGYFAPREGVWQEPIERNVFGLLRDLGDAEVASLIAPRPLVLQHLFYPNRVVSMEAAKGARAIAAPGKLSAPDLTAFNAEIARTKALADQPHPRGHAGDEQRSDHPPSAAQASADAALKSLKITGATITLKPDATRQKRLVRELEAFTQRLLVTTDGTKDAVLGQALPLKSLPEFEAHTVKERERFWNEVIGRLPNQNLPMNAKSRFVRETDKVRIYEVTLDVWDNACRLGLAVSAEGSQGWREASRRRLPARLGRHPEDTITTDRRTAPLEPTKPSRCVSRSGFVTFAPHNPYRGKDAFRTLQRKLNPLGLTLYSVINHQRILEWLKAQPFTQRTRSRSMASATAESQPCARLRCSRTTA